MMAIRAWVSNRSSLPSGILSRSRKRTRVGSRPWRSSELEFQSRTHSCFFQSQWSTSNVVTCWHTTARVPPRPGHALVLLLGELARGVGPLECAQGHGADHRGDADGDHHLDEGEAALWPGGPQGGVPPVPPPVPPLLLRLVCPCCCCSPWMAC